jgi:protease I
MSGKRILMLVGDFVEDYEAMVPKQILEMMGCTVDVTCPDKKKGDHVVTAIHDFEGYGTYTEKRGHNFPITVDWDGPGALNPRHYHGLVIPGGRSPEYLQLDERVHYLVQHFFSENKAVAATCHGPMILSAAGVLKGRKLQAYPSLRFDLERAGATYESPSSGLDSACVDGKLVTSPAWPSNPNWMREFLKVLGVTSLPA